MSHGSPVRSAEARHETHARPLPITQRLPETRSRSLPIARVLHETHGRLVRIAQRLPEGRPRPLPIAQGLHESIPADFPPLVAFSEPATPISRRWSSSVSRPPRSPAVGRFPERSAADLPPFAVFLSPRGRFPAVCGFLETAEPTSRRLRPPGLRSNEASIQAAATISRRIPLESAIIEPSRRTARLVARATSRQRELPACINAWRPSAPRSPSRRHDSALGLVSGIASDLHSRPEVANDLGRSRSESKRLKEPYRCIERERQPYTCISNHNCIQIIRSGKIVQ